MPKNWYYEWNLVKSLKIKRNDRVLNELQFMDAIDCFVVDANQLLSSISLKQERIDLVDPYSR